MPKGSWIARIEVTEAGRYGTYASALPAVVERFGGRFLVVGGRFEAAEGQARQRNVVIEFDDYETARACWRSPEYAEVARRREGAATGDVGSSKAQQPTRGTSLPTRGNASQVALPSSIYPASRSSQARLSCSSHP